MALTTTDGIVMLYNYAVLISASYATMQYGIEDRWVMFGVMFVFAIVWTVYFRIGMLPRLSEQLAPSDDS